MPEPALSRDRAPPRGTEPAAGGEPGVPSGFDLLAPPAGLQGPGALWQALREHGRAVLVRSSARDTFLRHGIQDPAALASSPLIAGWIEGGRTRHALLSVEGESWVLKSYRRGGWMGRWNADRYWRPERFVEELRIAAHAREHGVPTAEVVGLIVERAGWGSVRAWLVTRYLAGVRPLPDYLEQAGAVRMFHAAGEAVRRMHEAAIDHPDLNWMNLVGAWDGAVARVHIVDWDRACIRAPGTWNPCSNLVRLWRSAEKARRHGGRRDTAQALRAFLRGYYAGRGPELRRHRPYFRRQARLIVLRSLFWGRAAR